MNTIEPVKKPANSFRVKIELGCSRPRVDQVLIEELRKQKENLQLKNISRMGLKKLFKARSIQIKGQSAIPSSGLAQGTTYVDILGFGEPA